MNPVLFGGIVSEVGNTAAKFGVDWPHLIAQIITFLVVAALLHRFAYQPILKTLEDRKQRIAEGLANADKIKQELARTEEARRDVLAKADAQANRLIEEARQAAAKVLEVESQKAIATANQIIAKAREASEVELARMKNELRREMGRLVVQTSIQVTGKILTADDQRRLAEETNRELAA
jgi:F-type H+-transporting ATPase subunit b